MRMNEATRWSTAAKRHKKHKRKIEGEAVFTVFCASCAFFAADVRWFVSFFSNLLEKREKYEMDHTSKRPARAKSQNPASSALVSSSRMRCCSRSCLRRPAVSSGYLPRAFCPPGFAWRLRGRFPELQLRDNYRDLYPGLS